MTTAPLNQPVAAPPRRRWHLSEKAQTLLILSPSLIALAIFVYVFIGTTFYVSLSNWRTLKPNLTLRATALCDLRRNVSDGALAG